MIPTSALRLRPLFLFSGLLLLVLLAEYLVIQRPDFSTRPALPAAVTFDLLIGLPLLFYFLVVRRYQLPLTTIVGAFVGALALGYYLIPAGQQQYLGWASRGLVLVEAGAAGLAVINLRRLLRAYAEAAQQNADFVENLHAAFAAVFRRPLAPLVSELVMFRYALLGWWAPREVRPGELAFSSHRNSGFLALIIAFASLSVIETVAVHLLFSRWSATAALVLLVLDGYTLIFLLAHLRAVVLRPLTLRNGRLTVRVGFVWRLEVPTETIVELKELRDTPEPDKHCLNLARPLFTPPNVRLTFAAPVTVIGLYGIRRTVRQVALYVDERPAFLQRLHALRSVE